MLSFYVLCYCMFSINTPFENGGWFGGKIPGQRGCYLIIEFIDIINLKVVGGYGINVEKFGVDQFTFALHGLH